MSVRVTSLPSHSRKNTFPALEAVLLLPSGEVARGGRSNDPTKLASIAGSVLAAHAKEVLTLAHLDTHIMTVDITRCDTVLCDHAPPPLPF